MCLDIFAGGCTESVSNDPKRSDLSRVDSGIGGKINKVETGTRGLLLFLKKEKLDRTKTGAQVSRSVSWRLTE